MLPHNNHLGDAMLCGLCGCQEARTFHHLIPRTMHGNKWFKKRFTREEMQQGIDLCGDCHRAVHDLIPSEKELGRHYHTLQTLLQHPEVAKYVAWKRKKARAAPGDLSIETPRTTGDRE